MQRLIVVTICLICLGLSVTGCQWLQLDDNKLGGKDPLPKEVIIYFTKHKGTEAVTEAVVRKLPDKNTKA